MNLFKSFTLKWWQAGLFKISIIAGGIAIGAYWHQIFTPFLVLLVAVSVLAGSYVGYVWWKQ